MVRGVVCVCVAEGAWRREDESPGMKVGAKLETWTWVKDLIRRKFAGEDTVVSMSWRLTEWNLRMPGSLLLPYYTPGAGCAAAARLLASPFRDTLFRRISMVMSAIANTDESA